jgi:hypothetical protein
MPPIRSSALPAAVLITLFAGACQDAPVGPRAAPNAPASAVAHPRVEAFSGARADSVMNVMEATWSKLGHPEYAQARLSWRKRNGIVAGDSSARARSSTKPNAVLDEGSTEITGSESGPALGIIDHYEALHFGWHDAYSNVATGVEAEITFKGDGAQINLNSLDIRRNSGGADYITSGTIATGPGQIVNCADVLVGQCDNRRHLNGVRVFYDAPWCDASGNGTVNYWAYTAIPGANVTAPPTSSNVRDAVTAAGQVGGSAQACPKPGDNTGPQSPAPDTVVQVTPVGTGGGGEPRSPGPALIDDGSSGFDSGSGDFVCQEVQIFLVINDTTKILLEDRIECSRAS